MLRCAVRDDDWGAGSVERWWEFVGRGCRAGLMVVVRRANPIDSYGSATWPEQSGCAGGACVYRAGSGAVGAVDRHGVPCQVVWSGTGCLSGGSMA